MTDIKALRESTLNAATAARDAGLITPQQFTRMTDGTVSMADVSLARDLVTRHAADDKLGVAQDLSAAVANQNKAQGSGTNIKEALKDFFFNGADKENQRRVLGALK